MSCVLFAIEPPADLGELCDSRDFSKRTMTARDPNSDADTRAARRHMVQRDLRGRGIRDERVLAAMARVPRELFVQPESYTSAYSDCALPIDCDQTISQPFMVALMTEALQLTGEEHVLEIGTGSGYQTAVLAELAREVTTIERHAPLAQAAADRLSRLGYQNVRVLIGDGAQGAAEWAPFDCILITAAAPDCPPPLWDQLRDGGLLVGPFGPAGGQRLQARRKLQDRAEIENLVECRFVPFVLDSE